MGTSGLPSFCYKNFGEFKCYNIQCNKWGSWPLEAAVIRMILIFACVVVHVKSPVISTIADKNKWEMVSKEWLQTASILACHWNNIVKSQRIYFALLCVSMCWCSYSCMLVLVKMSFRDSKYSGVEEFHLYFFLCSCWWPDGKMLLIFFCFGKSFGPISNHRIRKLTC